MAVVGEFTKGCLALVAGRGRPAICVSDSGAELTIMAILRWTQETRIEWHYIAASQPGMPPWRASAAACRLNRDGTQYVSFASSDVTEVDEPGLHAPHPPARHGGPPPPQRLTSEGKETMSYRTILVHVESKAEARTRLAFDLARRHDAVLIGLSVAMWTPPGYLAAPEVPVTAEMVEEWRQLVQEELKHSAEQFRRLADEIAVRTEWRSLEGFPYAALCNAANAADLIIVGPLDVHADSSQLGLVDPGDLLIGAGRPVMIVPGRLEKLEARNIVVAWKNTREARRAVADALPILTAAESVSLVQIREAGADTESVNDVHQFLSAHQVRAGITIQDSDRQPADAHLMRIAKELKSDLIVAGAYGRSRLREWAFGGVTRSLLKQNAIACQLSH